MRSDETFELLARLAWASPEDRRLAEQDYDRYGMCNFVKGQDGLFRHTGPGVFAEARLVIE